LLLLYYLSLLLLLLWEKNPRFEISLTLLPSATMLIT
jgi:hypothetical protein